MTAKKGIFLVLAASTVLVFSFQNCQKQPSSSDGNSRLADFCVGNPEDFEPSCTPSGGGKSSGSLGIVGTIDRVFYYDEGKPLHDQLGTEAPIFAGWVFDTDNPGKSLEVNLYLDGQYCLTTTADVSRGDVKNHPQYPGDPANYGFGIPLENFPQGKFMAVVKAIDPNTCEEIPLQGNGYVIEVEEQDSGS